ncbi:MAG: DUF1028 domain-containing protein [Anaerolineae bacterium]|nr:DUF1028 domain-containing protein [Anaerolineae bacterium]MDW8099446.1 DUF1028 domain-containing protein [Anaerolineae bacterium]
MSAYPHAHTFSIVARDPATGEMGVAVQSHWFSVGSIVPWGEAGVGVVATQSFVEVSYGPLGLELLKAGRTPEEALRGLLAADPHPEVRQVAMLDAQGRVAVHTGKSCIPFAGHQVGREYAVQANLMAGPEVWPAMARAFENASGDLAERLLAALEAGQEAGGDVRGRQSAAILIVQGTSTGRPWADRVMDLRVEDHPDPISELRRLVRLARAYRYSNQGDVLMADGKIEQALQAYAESAKLAPEIKELAFWQAVTLANVGRIQEAREILREVFAAEPQWIGLLDYLPGVGLLPADPRVVGALKAAATPP